MSNKLLVIMMLFIFNIIFSTAMFLFGMFIGGNYFTNFELFGRRGYEAFGNLGFFTGIMIGIILSVIFYRKMYSKTKKNHSNDSI